MSRRTSTTRDENDDGDDDWDEDWDDDFDGDAEDFDEEPTIPCPDCGREIYEDAQRCPACGRYISAEDAPPARKPWWILVGVAACLYAAFRWIFG